ncbi:circadian clock KaiB family protein [Oculatella sp. LEGE 06141]|uniref:circadian clock KaiB family protein n=1 Tax=Oculatella sp. LEGE 06141 TaxID=1828648 RepID=UPI00187FA76A|nr:circadian clock KaiB family protein [Oculatella sp. LEGE 06141]MBE9177968.1 circadian clock KaiB family protein [Oculatella sp. LEGE 06141]
MNDRSNRNSPSDPKVYPDPLFKGIALFTPGGDLVYCIDPQKRVRWHLQLCAVLQDLLVLPELPHFLVPCYTATIDRWIDPKTQAVQTSAEACPFVLRHQALLNAVFEMGDFTWQVAPHSEDLCDLMLMTTYQHQFPQLWQNHDLVVRFETVEPQTQVEGDDRPNLAWSPRQQAQTAQGYVLRLFVSGHSAATERILQNLHQLLEKSLQQPYTLKVVDIYKHPDLAEADQVAATPTLVKAWPLPVRRMVGDLNDANKILRVLATVEQVEP